MRSWDNMVRSEYEIMANAVTIEQMEIINQQVDWDDLDGLNGDASTVNYPVGSLTVDFTCTVAVQYVDATGTPSASPTSYKEVALTTSSDRYSVALVTHTRIFAD